MSHLYSPDELDRSPSIASAASWETAPSPPLPPLPLPQPSPSRLGVWPRKAGGWFWKALARCNASGKHLYHMVRYDHVVLMNVFVGVGGLAVSIYYRFKVQSDVRYAIGLLSFALGAVPLRVIQFTLTPTVNEALSRMYPPLTTCGFCVTEAFLTWYNVSSVDRASRRRDLSSVGELEHWVIVAVCMGDVITAALGSAALFALASCVISCCVRTGEHASPRRDLDTEAELQPLRGEPQENEDNNDARSPRPFEVFSEMIEENAEALGFVTDKAIAEVVPQAEAAPVTVESLLGSPRPGIGKTGQSKNPVK